MSDPILVVEDDPFDAKLIQRAFKKARIVNPIQVVSDGEAAIAYIEGRSPYEQRTEFPLPSLMLLDLKMPRKDGFEVLQWLRAQPGLGRLPVVVLTSSNQPKDINRAYELGANSYLVKPVGSEELVKMLQMVEVYWMLSNTRPSLEPPAS